MKQVPVSDFLPTLRTMVNVPLDFVMAQAVVEAAAEFCSKSNVLLHTRELDRSMSTRPFGLSVVHR